MASPPLPQNSPGVFSPQQSLRTTASWALCDLASACLVISVPPSCLSVPPPAQAGSPHGVTCGPLSGASVLVSFPSAPRFGCKAFPPHRLLPPQAFVETWCRPECFPSPSPCLSLPLWHLLLPFPENLWLQACISVPDA